MRYFLMVLGIGAVGGALAVAGVVAAVWPEPRIVYQTIVRTVEVEVEPTFEPLPRGEHRIDDQIDWDEFDRDNDCLFEFLQAEQVPITLEVVWAAGYWADALGGPCVLIGKDGP